MELSEIKNILLKSRLGGRTRLYNYHNLDIKGISYDSRSVKPGDIFVAIPGEQIDGHNFIPDAIQRGAISIVSSKKLNLFTLIPYFRVADPRQALAVISNHFFKYPSAKLKVIGITGTNGKTTTAYLLGSILAKAGHKTGLLTTIKYIIGDREIKAENTTPESYVLQSYFSAMLQLDITHVVMEVSSHSLAMNRVFGINFHRAVFTNLTRDHLDFHKTPTNYRKAKGILFEQLSPQTLAIINFDDPVGKYYLGRTSAQIIGYHLIGNKYFGSSKKLKPSDIRGASLVQAEIEESSLTGNTITLKTPIGGTSIHSSLIGQHNVYNVLAASATAVSMGIPVNTIKEGIEAMSTVRGRMELIDTGEDYSVMVDFAHTEDALRNVLLALKPLVKGRIITVFGCGGDRDRGKRPLMGKVVSKYSDLFVVTSDNPRREDPLAIINDIKKGIPARLWREVEKSGCVEPDRYSAIKKALTLARKGDLVLIAGKGHETYQILKDTVKPFDDREVVRQILNNGT